MMSISAYAYALYMRKKNLGSDRRDAADTW